MNGTFLAPGQMAVLDGKSGVTVLAQSPSQVIALGDEPLGKRFLLLSFVSSAKGRLQQAAEDWRQLHMTLPAGDDQEFTAMPAKRA